MNEQEETALRRDLEDAMKQLASAQSAFALTNCDSAKNRVAELDARILRLRHKLDLASR